MLEHTSRIDHQEIGNLLEKEDFAYHDATIGALFTDMAETQIQLDRAKIEQTRWGITSRERQGKQPKAMSETELIDFLQQNQNLTASERAEIFFEKRIGAGFSVHGLIDRYFGAPSQDTLSLVIAPQVLSPNLATLTTHAMGEYLSAKGYKTQVKSVQYDTDIWGEDPDGIKIRYTSPRLFGTNHDGAYAIEDIIHTEEDINRRMLRYIPVDNHKAQAFLHALGYDIDSNSLAAMNITQFHNGLMSVFGLHVDTIDKHAMDREWLNHKLTGDGDVGRDWAGVSILEHDEAGYRGAYLKFPQLRKRFPNGIPAAEHDKWRMHSETYYRKFPMQLAPYALRPDLVLLECFSVEGGFLNTVKQGRDTLERLIAAPKVAKETWISGRDELGEIIYDGLETDYTGNAITSVDIPVNLADAAYKAHYNEQLFGYLDQQYADISAVTLNELHRTINEFTVRFFY
ncbi:MAG: hypothetical protein ACEQSA_04865 [Weeksellaceae bacterium]